MPWEMITEEVLRTWGGRTHPMDLMAYLETFLKSLSQAGPQGILPLDRTDIYDPDYLRPYFRFLPEPGGTGADDGPMNQHGLLAVVGFASRRPRRLDHALHRILAETLRHRRDLVVVIAKAFVPGQVKPFAPELEVLGLQGTHVLFLQPAEDCSGYLVEEPQRLRFLNHAPGMV